VVPCAFLAAFGLLTTAGAQVDEQINKSVWKQKFGVLDTQMNDAGWLSQDADGDGINNGSEFVAGTNPFFKLPTDANFRPPAVVGNPTTLSLTFPTVPGKLYGAESNMNLVDTWLKGSLPSVVGDGTNKTLTVPKSAGNFFHVTVTDQTTQGDQVSDWAKFVLGLSPSAPVTSQTSFNSASLAANLQAQNVVSINAVDDSGTQPTDNATPAGDFGVLRITRSGFMTLGSVTVPLSKSGTGVEGVDFAPLPTSLTFPVGVNSLDVKITPLFNASRTTTATVFLTASSPGSVGSSGNYTLGSPSFAGVTIYPSGNPTGTGLTGSYYVGSNATYNNAANFGGISATYAYTKTGNTVNATITYAGTPATAFADGNPVILQFTSGNLSTSFNSPLVYTIAAPLTATTFKVNFTSASVAATGSGNLTIGSFVAPLTRLDPLVDFASTTSSFYPPLAADNFTVKWTGQVLPQYSQNYYFVVNCDDSAKLWLNNQPQTLRRLTNDNPSVVYTYTQNSSTSGTVVVAYNSAPINVGDVVKMNFSVGSLTAAFGNVAPYTVTAVTSSNFTVQLTGENLPVSSSDSANRCRIDTTNYIIDWQVYSSVDRYCSIPLLAGTPYDIRLELREGTGSAKAQLSWYSDDQAKQVIPTNRLFPTISGTAPLVGNPAASPPSITSPTSAVTFMGAGTPFTMDVTSSNGGTVTSPDLPGWLTLDNGVLSGTPPAAGIYQFTLTTTNASGTSSVVMTLEVQATPGQLTRELWTSGVTGPAVSNVPWTSSPSATGAVSTAESATPLADNTGERLRGYFTAPTTGNYYFWIAASNAAELWISNNREPVNKILRAKVTGPGGTPQNTWNAQNTQIGQIGQKSQWLSLVAGKQYYIEALHNTGASGSSSHLSLAWFLDPTGNTASPITNGSGIIPGHLLSPWDNPPTTSIPGTLYVTNLQGAASGITGTGGAFLRVNGTDAVLQLNYSGLTSGATSRKIYNSSGGVIFDINAQEKNYPDQKTSDGGYSLTLQSADLADLNNGGVYIGISTQNNPTTPLNPAGELKGTFGKIAGSQTAPPIPTYTTPPVSPTTDDAANSRFLSQATFGPSPADLVTLKTVSYSQWLDGQFATAPTKNVPYILENLSADPQNPYGSTLMFNSWWKNSITAPDQLRQRAAFALSEILVVSDTGPLNNNGRVLADYYDTLLDNCFGNFRDILKQVTLSPAMGVYLDMRGNALGDIKTGLHPNENYAREILQLFSSGLYRTWPDGTLVLDSSGYAVPTYDQSVISGMARVFTGWNWGQALQGSGRLPTNFGPSSNYLDPMVLVPSKHELGSKILLDNVVLPPAVNTDSNTGVVDPNPISIQSTSSTLGQGNLVTTAISNQYDLNGLEDLEAALDNIMSNSAVGPYICRQLIQRLVTSHPKPDYLYRVVRAFNGEQYVAPSVATGVRGDLKEVFRAILLDNEARSATAAADPKFGKQREPLLRVTGPARAFPAADFPNSDYSQSGTGTITITTPTPHRLISGDNVRLSNFVDAGGIAAQAPTTQTYPIGNVTANSFTVSNNATSTLAYTITGDGVIGYTASIAPTGVVAGDQIYVKFTTGSLAGGTFDKVYTVGAPAGSNFTIPLDSSPVGTTGGSCLVPKLVSGYNVTGTAGSQTITIQTTGNHNLVAGDQVQLKFTTLNSPLPAASVVYAVTSVAGPNSFKVTSAATITNGSQGGNSVTVYPLKGSQWTRSGKCTVELSTWGIGSTPTNLNQTPLNSTTVFNFFYPDYQYPGAMAQAGMTTPEFQLTNDSNTMNLTNLITQGTLTNNGSSTGYITFFGSNSITLDMSPYMTVGQTKGLAAIQTLVNTLGDRLTGGHLSSAVKTTISNYVANTTNYPPATGDPSVSQMRDRVRAVVNLIAISAEYAIQK
jgi:uncharacterized protein (DUF1800 family)